MLIEDQNYLIYLFFAVVFNILQKQVLFGGCSASYATHCIIFFCMINVVNIMKFYT